MNRLRIEREKEIYEGDIISVGDSIIIFEDFESIKSPQQTTSSSQFVNETLLSSHSESKQDLITLLTLGYYLQREITELDNLLKIVLNMAVNALQCESGYIEYDSGVNKRAFFQMEDKLISEYSEMMVSEAILNHVRSSQLPIILEDARIESEFQHKKSVIDYNLRSVLCTCFTDQQNNAKGILCLQDCTSSKLFEEKDLYFAQQLTDYVSSILENATIIEELKYEKQRVEKNVLELEREYGTHRFFVGQSKKMLELQDKIDRVAAVQSTVLLKGETGTGKGLVARLIHQQSNRSDKPFISLNCAGLPESLIESELFGYEKGAFTGAQESKEGMFELVNGGTLFLDEIADMSLNAQAKVLSVLEEKTVRRLAGKRTISVDVRIIAATHKDLDDLVIKGQFRQDLLYRLKVAVLEIPPLREHLEDIPLLIEYYLDLFNQQMPKCPRKVAKKTMKILQQYQWPGNVRELRNVIESAIIWCNSRTIQPHHIPAELRLSRGNFPNWEAVEEDYLKRALDFAAHNITTTAKIMGINRSTVYEKLKKYRLLKNNKQ